MFYLSFCKSNNWFVQIELYGGTNSAINNVALNATAFAYRSSMFTIQFYTSSESPPFPEDGFKLLDGKSLFTPYAHMNNSSHWNRNGV